VLDLPSLFGGKMHAALFRKWQNRIKGRDFYDVQWFIARGIPLKKTYFEEKIRNSGLRDALLKPITRESVIEMFKSRILSVDWEQAKADAVKFLRNKDQVKLWSTAFFSDLISNISLVD
jgi:hypothetical protein